MSKTLLLGIALVAGIATALQATANAGLAARIGLAAALVANTIVVLAGTLVLYFVRGGPYETWTPAGTPWPLYLGGVCGLVILASLAFVFPRVGAALAIALVVLGQGGAALAIDHFGLMGMPKEPVTLLRIAGLVLVGGGVVLMRA